MQTRHVRIIRAQPRRAVEHLVAAAQHLEHDAARRGEDQENQVQHGAVGAVERVLAHFLLLHLPKWWFPIADKMNNLEKTIQDNQRKRRRQKDNKNSRCLK